MRGHLKRDVVGGVGAAAAGQLRPVGQQTRGRRQRAHQRDPLQVGRVRRLRRPDVVHPPLGRTRLDRTQGCKVGHTARKGDLHRGHIAAAAAAHTRTVVARHTPVVHKADAAVVRARMGDLDYGVGAGVVRFRSEGAPRAEARRVGQPSGSNRRRRRCQGIVVAVARLQNNTHFIKPLPRYNKHFIPQIAQTK